jgi:glycerol 3-phosphatase-2
MTAIPSLFFDDAWAGYRRWEHRLPSKPAPITPERVGGLRDLLDDFDVFILDNFGVLSLGTPVIPEGLPAVRAIRAAGKPIRVITNDAARHVDDMARRHQARGYDFQAEEIVPGYRLLGEALSRFPQVERWGAIGTGDLPMPELTAGMPSLTDDPAAAHRVDGIVLFDSQGWDEVEYGRLEASFFERPRPVVVCNPDVTAPYPDMLSAETGWFAHRLADATGVEPLFIGKPWTGVYDLALADLHDIPRERVLCVGDTLHTDVIGGRIAGCRTLLVETGFTRGRDPIALAEECGIWPDFISATV